MTVVGKGLVVSGSGCSGVGRRADEIDQVFALLKDPDLAEVILLVESPSAPAIVPLLSKVRGIVCADGGMTWAGVAMSIATATAVGGLVTSVSPLGFWPVFAGGLAGSFADSLLGATVERPWRLGNEGVNFLSSTVAAGAGLWLSWTLAP